MAEQSYSTPFIWQGHRVGVTTASLGKTKKIWKEKKEKTLGHEL